MHRKLVYNKGSYLLTLPKKWVDKNKLSNKNEVQITEEENRLVVQPENYQQPRKEVEVHVHRSEEQNIRGVLFAMVRLGYSEVKITFNKQHRKEFVDTIGRILNNYIFGYEISEVKGNFCVISHVILTSQKMEVIEKKAFLIVKDTFKEVRSICKKEKKSLQPIIYLNKRMAQFDSLLRHNYSRNPLQNNPFKWQDYRDNYVIQVILSNLAKQLVEVRSKQKERVGEWVERFSKLYEKIYAAFFKYHSTEELEETGIKTQSLLDELQENISETTGLHHMILCYLFQLAWYMNLFNYTLLQLLFSEERED
jgi:hypothetical protein